MKFRNAQGQMTSRRFRHWIGVVFFGALLVVTAMVLIWQQALVISSRGSHEVLARVRVADSQTEDELFYDFSTVKKSVVRDGLFRNKTALQVTDVRQKDGTLLRFDDCTLTGVYAPRTCTAQDGKIYWLTITEDA